MHAMQHAAIRAPERTQDSLPKGARVQPREHPLVQGLALLPGLHIVTLFWWTCPRPGCLDRMEARRVDTDSLADLAAAEALVAIDRDAHIEKQHPEVVQWAPHMLAVSRYRWLGCHN